MKTNTRHHLQLVLMATAWLWLAGAATIGCNTVEPLDGTDSTSQDSNSQEDSTDSNVTQDTALDDTAGGDLTDTTPSDTAPQDTAPQDTATDVSCPPLATSCPGGCAVLAIDPLNCGVCGQECPAPETCVQGSCSTGSTWFWVEINRAADGGTTTTRGELTWTNNAATVAERIELPQEPVANEMFTVRIGTDHALTFSNASQTHRGQLDTGRRVLVLSPENEATLVVAVRKQDAPDTLNPRGQYDVIGLLHDTEPTGLRGLLNIRDDGTVEQGLLDTALGTSKTFSGGTVGIDSTAVTLDLTTAAGAETWTGWAAAGGNIWLLTHEPAANAAQGVLLLFRKRPDENGSAAAFDGAYRFRQLAKPAEDSVVYWGTFDLNGAGGIVGGDAHGSNGDDFTVVGGSYDARPDGALGTTTSTRLPTNDVVESYQWGGSLAPALADGLAPVVATVSTNNDQVSAPPNSASLTVWIRSPGP